MSVMAGDDWAEQLNDVAVLYRMRDEESVKAYLRSHSTLIPILREARAHIVAVFGPEVEADLRLPSFVDSDYGGDLLAMIQCHSDADEALDALDKLWDVWWMNASEQPDARPLYIGVEYAGEVET
jgi:hypothetical protein